jgi:LacI family transcriptional regulator
VSNAADPPARLSQQRDGALTMLEISHQISKIDCTQHNLVLHSPGYTSDGGMVKMSIGRRVTIGDVARASKTSVSTVSLVLRSKPGIGLDTRRRVLEAARALGYRRQSPAAVSSGQATLNIGLILRARARTRDVAMPVVNPFYSWVVAGIDAAGRQQRLNLLYASLPVDQENRPLDLPRHLLDQTLDGVLLVGAFDDETIDEIAAGRSAPVVLVDAPARSHQYDAVVSDNEGGAYAAVKHLIGLGHRHIALVAPHPQADPVFSQRRDGYLRAVREHGLEAYATDEARTPEEVAAAVAPLLRRQPEITALFGSNDTVAIAALRGAQAMGRRVPDDLSVIGFDDIEISGQTAPPLTTMAVDKLSMGILGVQLLSHRLAWPDAAIALTSLRPNLIERASTAPCPKAVDRLGEPRIE